MKQKSELRSNDAESEKQWVRRSLTRARVQLGQVAEALTPAASTDAAKAKAGDAAFGRMRELLQRDRANVVLQSTKPKAKIKSTPPPPPRAAYSVASPASSAAATASPAPAAAAQSQGAAAVQDPEEVAATTVAPATAATGRTSAAARSTAATAPAPAVAHAPAPAAASSEEGVDPIRTLTMARLLAVQGYRKRALSIYDELLAQNGSDASLRAEADRLRG